MCDCQGKPTRDGDHSAPYRCVDSFGYLTTSPFPGYHTLDELFQRAVDLYENADCLGTRELLSEEDELQPSGKVFHKVGIPAIAVSGSVNQCCLTLLQWTVIIPKRMEFV